jgi:hypothetical protein
MTIADKLQHSRLPRGTAVMAMHRFSGVIDGYTADGKHIVLFDVPVKFDTIGKIVYRACFERADVLDIDSWRQIYSNQAASSR